MSWTQHAEDKEWAFEALDQLEAFLADPDFDGTVVDERRSLACQRQTLRDAKYRVVFLGAFNVGKSTLINAFLGDEYLPTVLEECTAKTTHVVKSDTMKIAIVLSQDAATKEVDALRAFLRAAGVHAEVFGGGGLSRITIAYATGEPNEALKTLKALVTLGADEDQPRLKSLRGKFDDVFVHVPASSLEDDVTFIDSPGAHSISQTLGKVAEEIVPESHLVICMVDSQNVADERNKEFIRGIVANRGRKVFLVINKADQLNPDEIRRIGQTEPAMQLLQGLAGGAGERPELFFVSSLYGLVSAQLTAGRLELDDIDANNKIKVPWKVQKQLLESGDAAAGLGRYLQEQSNVPSLKERLLEYLYTENREGAVLEATCRYVDAKAWAYARRLQLRRYAANDIPMLAVLDGERERLTQEIAKTKATSGKTLDEFDTMSAGGQADGTDYPGYEAFADSVLTDDAVQEHLLDPLHKWLEDNNNLRTAKKDAFAPMAAEVERGIQLFLRRVQREINAHVDAVENAVREGSGRRTMVLSEPIEATPAALGPVRPGLGASYAMFCGIGVAVGAAAAALVGMTATIPDGYNPGLLLGITVSGKTFGAIVGGAAGILLGCATGLIVRAVTITEVLRERVRAIADDRVRAILLQGVSGELKELLATRREAFATLIETTFVQEDAELNRLKDAALEDQEQLKEDRDKTIARLAPKRERLAVLARAALDIANAHPRRD